MRLVRRLVAVSLLASLVAAGIASANHQDPQKKLTKADNARARAMLLKRTDLAPGFRAQQAGGEDPHNNCSASVSESDLTLTGEAEGPQFALGVTFVGSASQVYESVADAATSWRRSTSAAGTKCATALLRREFAKQGIRLVSVRKIAFPRVYSSDRTVAYRVKLSATSPQGTVSVFLDLVGLMRTRAHATVIVGSALVAPERAYELDLAQIVAGRMAKAMS